MCLIALVVIGCISFRYIPVSLMPDIDIPQITVQVSCPGASVREVDSRVVAPLRGQLMQVAGLKDIHSESRMDAGTLFLEFEAGSNIDLIFIEVNEKIDRAMSRMPKELERPKVIKASAMDIPAFYLDLSLKDEQPGKDGSLPTAGSGFARLGEFARNIVSKRIEQLPQTAMVDFSGTTGAEIICIPDERKLQSMGMDMEALANAIQKADITLGALSVVDGLYRYNLHFDAQLLTKEDIENVYLNHEGRLVQLKDLCRVEEKLAARAGLVRHGVRNAVTMAVIKQNDAQMEDLQESIDNLVESLRKEYPESLFPMAADVLCRQVSEWFRRELLLHVKTTQLSRTLLVEVSGLLSGPHTSLSDTPVTEREAYKKKVKGLQELGWVYKTRYGSLEIVDCPTSLRNIRKEISRFGGRMPSIQLLDGSVRSFSFRIPSDKCSELFQTMSGKPDLEEKPAGDTVTEDDVAVIQRNLKDLRFALSNINLMADRSIMKNRSLRERQEEMGQEALASLDLRAAYDKIEAGLQKVFYPLGLRVDDLHAFSYATTRFSAMPRDCYKDLKLRPELEFVQEPGDRMVYLRNTPENIDRLVAIVRETMPGAKLESLEVAVRDFGQIIKKVQFMISPADIAKMLDVTKSMEEVSDF